ncbi:sigma-54-dependent transcriptional regulator [Pyxidicoccus xibeiensis]|uniref:sigma-54-dependent transcriptional regulator n=1 Tax=Pyxidicoccus xibeiensis TaxID=2906759 RepID=UPI0020A816EA|nr:sigma 54-interacting transcriptional regulator [Pyxidicoccus xibeiensis]MCP3137422.1 sigma-54 dependent transcriptional regulator [Pyxidicoccus xibeiensis]
MNVVDFNRQSPVVIVDRDDVARRSLGAWAEAAGYAVREYATAREALEADSSEWLAVCLELGLEDMVGLDVLRHLRARDTTLPVIVLTRNLQLDTAVDATRLGAFAFLDKAFEPARLERTLQSAAKARRVSWRALRCAGDGGAERLIGAIVGRSAPMRVLARQLERILQSDVPVCISGETGTGKELVARALHEQGARARGPFVAVNCAAFSESLLESELFGHERGAFTGALAMHRGCFEQAQGGTLFLDEVGEMSSATQVRLLRILQERTLRRVGSTAEVRVDVRIIAATHRDLMAEVKAGRFREDLYYRLAVYPVQVPALRERATDILPLVDHFLEKFGGPSLSLTDEAREALVRHRWPGNVRELQNVVQRAILSCDGARIELADLPPELRVLVLPPVPAAPPPMRTVIVDPPAPSDAVVPLRELERREILKALTVTNGSVTKAAKLLGLGRATLYRRVAELHIQLEPGPGVTLAPVCGRPPS